MSIRVLFLCFLFYNIEIPTQFGPTISLFRSSVLKIIKMRKNSTKHKNTKVHQHVKEEKNIFYNNTNNQDEFKLLKNTILLENSILDKEKLQIVFCSDGGVKNNEAGFGLFASVGETVVISNKQRLLEMHNTYTSH
jgi:mannose-6-phosphate isomerase class I